MAIKPSFFCEIVRELERKKQQEIKTQANELENKIDNSLKCGMTSIPHSAFISDDVVKELNSRYVTCENGWKKMTFTNHSNKNINPSREMGQYYINLLQ